MIDIHSHILHGVDDGPENLQQSLALLEQAVKEGITDIISTSHVLHPTYDASAQAVVEQVASLQTILNEQKIPLTIHTGHEIRISEEMPELFAQGKLLPLANSKYILVELPSNIVPTYTKPLLFQLQEQGYIPIIAHPERNKAIAENPRRLRDLIDNGALAQITAGSVAGHFGKQVQKISMNLIESNLIHTYGSDVHHLQNRPFLYEEGLSYLEKHKLADTVEVLLENNARILTDERMIILEPQTSKEKKWWKIF
jgi:protein-tyrosine phosphatase